MTDDDQMFLLQPITVPYGFLFDAMALATAIVGTGLGDEDLQDAARRILETHYMETGELQ